MNDKEIALVAILNLLGWVSVIAAVVEGVHQQYDVTVLFLLVAILFWVTVILTAKEERK